MAKSLEVQHFMYKEVRYCSEQMKSLDFIFKEVGKGTVHDMDDGSEYHPVDHDINAQSSAAEVKNQSNVLRSARPKK